MSNSKKILITQSNYIPWKGYFDALNHVDEVILYDTAQYTKRDWRNRNLIKTPHGLKWISVPVQVKGKFAQSIQDVKINDPKWNLNHWNIISQNYKSAPYFNYYKEFWQEKYFKCNYNYLSEINHYFILAVNKFLNINTPIKFSSEFNLIDGKTSRLIDLCKKTGSGEYYSGMAAKSYLDENQFRKENINIHYFDYRGYPEYEQLYGPFEHGVSILDLIFNKGPETQKFMKTFNGK